MSLRPTTPRQFQRWISLLSAIQAAFLLSLKPVNALNMDIVQVGNPGNAADDTGFGAVPNSFAIGTFEVTNAQYAEFLNAVDPNGTNPNGIHHTGMHNEARGGILFRSFDPTGAKYYAKSSMANKPVNFVNWFDAARFVNWLHNGQPIASSTNDSYNARETGAYTLNNALTGTILKNPGAKWWIPSENEWYKAAYYKGGNANAGYWDYPSQSQSYNPPSSITADSSGNGPGNTGNRANFNKTATWNPSTEINVSAIASPTSVGTNGGPSAYGAYDMGGNAMEINDGVFFNARGRRGGGYDSTVEFLSAAQRGTSPFSNDTTYSTDGAVIYTLATMQQGFRVATGIDPVVAQTSVVEIYSNAISVSSRLVDGGGGTIIERGFIHAPGSNDDPYIGNQGVVKVVAPGTSSGNYSAMVKVLSPGQSYTIRSFATSSIGTGYGEAVTFTTLGSGDNSAPTDIVLSANSINEGNTPPTIIGSFSAVDANLNDYHGFALQAGEGSTDNSLFNIKRTGDVWNLTLNSAADFETKPSYSIRVFTADNGTGTLGFSKVFNIAVTNLNEAPRITSNGGGSTASISLAENIAAVTTVAANDPDLPSQTITYSIIGGTDASRFNIHPTSGVLTFVAAADFEQPSDADTNNQFEVIVGASDNGNPTATASQTITVTITDVPEPPAVISATALALSDKKALLNATVLASGAGSVSARGFVISPALLTSRPVIGGIQVIQIPVTGTTGAFDAITASLTANTEYVVRAYATNAIGTGYSSAAFFTTLGPDSAPEFAYAELQDFSLYRIATPEVPTITGGRMTGEAFRNATTYAGNGTSGSANGILTAARFNRPWGLAMDSNGNIYVADDGNSKIRRIAPNGVVSDFGSSIQYPRAVAVDANNNVYAASNNHAIYRITPSGTTAVFAGAVNSAGSTDSTVPTSARFRDPEGLSMDPTGTYLLVADRSNHKIRKIDIASGAVTTFAGNASNTSGTEDGAALTTARFKEPYGIAFAPDGNTIYVCEIGASTDRIRKIANTSGNWTVSSLAGSATSAGALDGTGSSALFNEPRNLAVDPLGNIYVGDGANHAIRKITPDGQVSTFAGSLIAGSGNNNGIGHAARFNDPRGVLFDPSGYLYVADTNNHQIRRISLGGYEISHQLPKGMTFDSSTGTIGGRPEEFSFVNYYTQDFNSSSLGGGTLSGNAGVAGNQLRLTMNSGGQLGAFTVNGSGANASDYRVSFHLITGKTSGGADGLSYSFAPDGSATSTSPAAEIGTGSGLSLSFATFNNNNPGIRLYYGTTKNMGTSVGSGGLIAYSNNASWRGSSVPVSMRIDAAGRVTVSVSGVDVFTNVQLPESFLTANRSTWNHYFKARTGGSFDIHAIDNLSLQEGLGAAVHRVTAYNPFGSHSTNVTIDVGFSPVLDASAPFITSTEFNASGIDLGSPSLSAAPGPHSVLTLVNNTGTSPINGNFNNRPEGSIITSNFNGDSFSFWMSYKGGDGNDITLTRILSPGQRDHCLVTNFAGQDRTTSNLLRPYGLVHDKLGNLYVTDHAKHQIVKFTPNGNYTVFAGDGAGHADGAAATAKFYSPMGLALDSQGSVYVADWWTHRVRKITQANLQSATGSIVSTIGGNGTTGNADGNTTTSRFNAPYGIKVDGMDTIYVADTNNNAVRKISPAGNTTTVLTPSGTNFAGVKDIIPDDNGDFFATKGITGSRYENGNVTQLGSTIQRYTASPLSLGDYSGNGTAGFADGSAGSAKYNFPNALARDFLGRIWIVDSGNHRIRRMAADGSVETMAGSTQGNATGLGSAALFNNPTFISVDHTGVAYVSDSSNFLIKKIVSTARPFLGNANFTKAGPAQMKLEIPVTANGFNTSVSINYQTSGLSPVNTTIPLSAPNSIDTQTASATLSNIEVNTVYKYTITATNADGSVTQSGTFVSLEASFTPDRPMIMTADGFNASGIPLGEVSLGFAPAPHQSLLLVDNYSNSAIEGSFNNYPEGTIIPATYNGNTFNLQISYKGGDGNDIVLIRVSTPGQISNGLEWRVTTFAGDQSYNPMFQPFEIARDSAGNFYVTDWGIHVIWKIAPNGAISNFAGYSNSSGTQNGTGQNARFNGPHSIVIDQQDNIYVSDYSNHAIRKITQTGVVTTHAGSIGSSGNANGALTTARFSNPRGMTIDSSGNMYVLDNAGLRKITPSGIVSTVPSGQFYRSYNVGIYSNGTPAVSNAGAYSIVRVNSNGTNSIIAGNYTNPGSVDGTGESARFGKSSLSDSSIFFSIDPFDNIYAADTLNNTIRRITPEGVVTTIAGSTITTGNADGIGLSSRFNGPRGMLFAKSGEIYVVDTFNKRIRKMTAGALPIINFSGLTASPTQATLRGTVNPNGFITTARFEYGTTTNLGSSVNVTIPNPGAQSVQNVSANITNLVPSQTYYYRLVATNVDGTSTTSTGTFPSTNPPSFASAPTTPTISHQSASVSSVITDDGGVPVLERGILYDEVGGSGELVLENTGIPRAIFVGSSSSTYVLKAVNLKPNTWYRARSYAISGAGTGYSPTGTFQTGSVQVENVLVGNPGNFNDGYGAVGYVYRIGSYEVTNFEYAEFLNAVDPEGLNPSAIYSPNMTSDARAGIVFNANATNGQKYAVKNLMGSKPVVYVSWYDAARFTNWVHNGYEKFLTTEASYTARETGAYLLAGATSGSFTRNPRANAWIPSESEWYKAAYYNKDSAIVGGQVYFNYATSLHYNAAQAEEMSNPKPIIADSFGNSVFDGQGFRINWQSKAEWNGLIGNLVTVGTSGGPSPYGTYDQDGNVEEWTETIKYTGYLVTRGGHWASIAGTSSGGLYYVDYTAPGRSGSHSKLNSTEQNTLGFRIAMAAAPIPPSAPVVATSVTSSAITGKTASLTGSLTDSGGEPVTERGFVIATNSVNTNPQIGGTGVVKIVVTGSGTGSFSANALSLSGETSYTFRAYATNSLGTSYSANGSFITLQEPPDISYDSVVNLSLYQSTLISPVNSGGQIPTPTADGNTAANNRVVSTIAGINAMGLVDASGSAARFKGPMALDIDAQGNLYIADYSNNAIRKITPSGAVTTLAGNGTSGYVDGPIGSARFANPSAIALDSQGNIFVADGRCRLRKISSSGQVSTLAGGSFGSADGTGSEAQFSSISGMDIDKEGNLYISDQYNNAIRKVTPTGQVTTIAGGSQGAADGTGSEAQFNTPYGIACAPDGAIYVVDSGNHTIRKITQNGIVTTIAGKASARGSENGIASAARFNTPIGVDCDTGGNLYVSDHGNWRIRKITPEGDVSTIAGSTTGYYNPANGPANIATFAAPFGLRVDSSWNIWVCDYSIHQIRKISAAGYTINKPLPPGLVFNSFNGTISGTPSSLTEASEYVITAQNLGGSSSFVVTLGVLTPGSAVKPVLATPSSAGVAFAGASLFANATSDGGDPISERGFVISVKSANSAPEIGGIGVTKIVASGNGRGSFSIDATGLSSLTEYAYRAYATNTIGTSYSTTTYFTTTVDPIVAALAKIADYAGDSSMPEPEVADFTTAGVAGVDSDNIAAVLSALGTSGIASSSADSASKLQSIVNAYNKILAEANGVTGDVTPGDNPAASDYQSIGAATAAGLGTQSLGLLNSIVGTKDVASVNSVASIESLASIVSRLAVVASGQTASPSLSVSDFAEIGITGVDSSNIDAVLAALANTADDMSEMANLTLLQTVVDSVVNAGYSIETWRQTFFGTKTNSGNAANLANPSGDGIPNLIKYGLVLNPNERAPLPTMGMESNRLTINFKRDPMRADVRLIVEASNDLVNWSVIATSLGGNPFTGNAAVNETELTGGFKQVRVRDTIETSASTRRFLRVRTTLESN
jgi:sugar lactone lactonase YvrE/formylglycine-generating enzyme required for sulfatase activity